MYQERSTGHKAQKRMHPAAAKAVRLNAFKNITSLYPKLVRDLFTDLMKIDGYSENEIAFGSGTPIEIIRAIANNDYHQLQHEHLLKLLNFYTRVFCGWSRTCY